MIQAVEIPETRKPTRDMIVSGNVEKPRTPSAASLTIFDIG